MKTHHRTVRKMACALALALALALAAAACGKSPDSAMPADPPPSADAANGSAGGPSPAAPGAESPPSEAADDPHTSPSESPAESDPASVQTEPKYRMNKAYRIVPLDDSGAPKEVVLLTFDDGPKNAETLGKILDVLDKHRARAIFFVNGYRVKAKPELLREIDARGQVIGNHSYDHINLREQSDEKVREQIESVQRLVQELTGKTPRFFRPPFGAGNDMVKAIVKENGMLFMTWSNGSLDWDLGKKVHDKPQAVIDNVMEQLHPGSNILMHELEWTADALDRLLTQLEEKGYSFVDPDDIAIDLEE